MKLSAEIKKYFKNLGIPVRVRTVAVKNPFVQVWIESEGDWRTALTYKYEFPLKLRENLLKVIYGDGFVGAEFGNAGNVRPHSLSFSEGEWRATLIKMAEGQSLWRS